MNEIFIVYEGNSITQNEIKNELLKRVTNPRYTVKTKEIDSVKMAKTVYDNYLDYREPKYQNGVLYVGGYQEDDIEKANMKFYDKYRVDDSDEYHLLFWKLYEDCEEAMFLRLTKEMPFSCVLYDRNKGKIIAGTTGDDTHSKRQSPTMLYYGYKEPEHEILFANDENCLKAFCKEVLEVPPFTYYDGDEFICYKQKKEEQQRFIQSDPTNIKNFLGGLNDILSNITDIALRENVDLAIMEYLDTLEPKKIIGEYVSKEVTNDLKKRIYQIIRKELNAFQLENHTLQLLHEKFDETLREYAKKKPIPLVNIIQSKDLKTPIGQSEGHFHEKFETLLSLVQLDEPVMLIGPAGSGKNVAISQVAQCLGQHMYYTNNASNEFKLTGFIDAGGTYRDTEFYKAFKNGGVFFLDEIDNSDPSALIVINSALANGYMAFPHETIDRHPDFRVVAAANTWGRGSDMQYVGRNALDGATLDRFDQVFFDYDRNLEQALYPNDEVLEFMWSFRDAVAQSRVSHIVSTRGIGKVYKKEINHIPIDTTIQTDIVKGLRQDDVNMIIGNMRRVSTDNKYYQHVKKLRVGR